MSLLGNMKKLNVPFFFLLCARLCQESPWCPQPWTTPEPYLVAFPQGLYPVVPQGRGGYAMVFSPLLISVLQGCCSWLCVRHTGCYPTAFKILNVFVCGSIVVSKTGRWILKDKRKEASQLFDFFQFVFWWTNANWVIWAGKSFAGKFFLDNELHSYGSSF